MDLHTPLSRITGIGTTFAKRLEYLGLFTIEDLINHYPFRYDDFSSVTSSLEAEVGQKVTLQGEIWSIKNVYTRSRKVITQAIFNDGQIPINLTWFNSSWLTKQIQTGEKLQISGKLTKYKNKMSMVAPVWEKIATPDVAGLKHREFQHTGGLIPIYSETYGITSRWIRTKASQLLPKVENQIQDPLPDLIRGNMLPLTLALSQIHFPKSWQEAEQARQRLAFDELFYIQLATQKVRSDWHLKPSIEAFEIDQKKLDQFLKSLPFKLTNAQKRVANEIIEDLKKTHPMNRLVQGEVGSGKTVVATMITYITHLNGLKTLFMAPTEILAFQHYSTLTQMLEPFGIKVGIYTGSRKFTKLVIPREHSDRGNLDSTKIATLIARNDKVDTPDVIVGTHALLSSKLEIPDVGLIITDEQQRFGVQQRSLLRSRAKIPHFLTMTATPIPRTVALTIYGDLDLSIIDELPKGRKVVKTYLVPAKKRVDSYKFISKKINEGDQVYVITPLIEPSETFATVKSVKLEFEKLKDIFPEFSLGLLHGRLKSKEKEAVINDFKSGIVQILVSTSVVEVGVDVPNATIMVIEGAERFGLSQLHQLRGRVGRGEKESICLLYTSSSDDDTSRLKHLEKTYDGLKLAELDLKIRGGGEIFGTMQAGRFELKIASFNDLTLIEKTRDAARKLLQDNPNLDKHPLLKGKLLEISGNVMPD